MHVSETPGETIRLHRVIWGRQRFRLSIAWKTFIAFTLVMLIPLLGLLHISTRSLHDTLIADRVEDARLLAHDLQQTLDAHLRQVRGPLEQAARLPGVIGALVRADRVTLGNELELLAASAPQLGHWYAVDPALRILAQRGAGPQAPPLPEALLRTALQGRQTLASLAAVHAPQLRGTVVATRLAQVIIVPVVQGGQMAGALVAVLLLDQDGVLAAPLEHELRQIDGSFAALASGGTVIATSRDPAPWAPGDALPPSLADSLRRGLAFNGPLALGADDVLVAAEPLDGVVERGTGALIVGIQGRVVSERLDRHARQIYAVAAIGLLLSLLIAFLAYRDTVTPMRAIVAAMDDFGKGHLDVRTLLRTRDEFEELGAGFNRMSQAIQDQQRRLESYNSLSSLLINTLDPHELLSTTLDKVVELSGSVVGVIYLLDEDTRRLRPFVSHGVSLDTLAQLRLGEGLPGQAAIRRRSLIVRDIPKDCQMPINTGPIAVLPREAAVLPLLYKDVLRGVMMLGTLRAYPDEEAQMLDHLSKQIAIVLENSLTHAKVERLSITDSLTGVFNRRHLNLRMEEEFSRAQRYRTPLSVLVMDIDHFKQVNDRYGHLVGDNALVTFAELLQSCLRDSDIVGRYGGEEFVAMLPHTSLQDAQVSAEKIRQTVERTPIAGMEDNSLTISVGVSSFPESGPRTITDLLRSADRVLYDAKTQGRNRVVCAT